MTAPVKNPFESLISDTGDNAASIQSHYEAGRRRRAQEQESKILHPSFAGMTPDPILKRLLEEPDFVDPRHSMTFWARPPADMKDIVQTIQRRLCDFSPHLWIMAPSCLHLSVVEVAHSVTFEAIAAHIATIKPSLPKILQYPGLYPTRLVRPRLSYDTSGLALSFVPAADDAYTYHHLRRDLFSLLSSSGTSMSPRYAALTAHLTIGRFVNNDDFEKDGGVDAERAKAWIGLIDDINIWLISLWDAGETHNREWIVDNIECRVGTNWYGGGQSVV